MTHTGTDRGACCYLLLTSSDIECPIELSGLELLVLPSRQRRLRAQVARVLLQQRRPVRRGCRKTTESRITFRVFARMVRAVAWMKGTAN